MDQLPLQLSIAFFAFQVAAWAGLCLYLRATHQRRAEDALGAGEIETEVAAVAQAA